MWKVCFFPQVHVTNSVANYDFVRIVYAVIIYYEGDIWQHFQSEPVEQSSNIDICNDAIWLKTKSKAGIRLIVTNQYCHTFLDAIKCNLLIFNID